MSKRAMRVRPARCYTFVQFCQEASTMCIPKNVYPTAHVSCSCVCSLCPAEILLSGQQKGGVPERPESCTCALPHIHCAVSTVDRQWPGRCICCLSAIFSGAICSNVHVHESVFHCEMPELRTRMSPYRSSSCGLHALTKDCCPVKYVYQAASSCGGSVVQHLCDIEHRI